MTTPIYPIDIAITSLETITAFDVVTGNFLFAMDELQSASLSQTQDVTDITGKQGRKLARLKKNKAVKISGSNGMVSSGLLAMQSGSAFENGNTTVKWVDYLTVQNGKATTTYKAVGTTGAEIVEVSVKDNNGVVVSKLEQAATAAAGKFAYAPSSKQITFHTDVTDGTEIIVAYNRSITAMKMTNRSEAYSGKCTLYCDALGEDKCGNVYRVQIYIPKADFNGEWTFEMGDNPTVHSFEAESLAGACGAGGKLFDFTIFGVNTADN